MKAYNPQKTLETKEGLCKFDNKELRQLRGAQHIIPKGIGCNGGGADIGEDTHGFPVKDGHFCLHGKGGDQQYKPAEQLGDAGEPQGGAFLRRATADDVADHGADRGAKNQNIAEGKLQAARAEIDGNNAAEANDRAEDLINAELFVLEKEKGKAHIQKCACLLE